MKLAVLYAGQGAQHPGMGKEFYEASPAFRAAFDSAALDFDLHRVCFEDPDGVLNQTEYTQPCMVAFACGRKGRKARLSGGAFAGRILRAAGSRGVHRKAGHRADRLPGQGHGRGCKGPCLRHDCRAGTGQRKTVRLLRTGS